MDAPVLECPVDGVTGLDHKAPIVIVLDEHDPAGDLTATTGILIAAQNLEDSAAAGGWTDPTYMITTDGTQAQMADATETTQLNRVNFRGATWPGDETLIIKEVDPICYAGLNGGGGATNAAYVEWDTCYAGKHRAKTIFGAPGSTWTGSGAASLQSNYGTRPVSMFALLQDLLGTRFTIGELKDLLDEADPDASGISTLANFRVAVRPYSYYGYDEAGYHVAGIQLKISYFTGAPTYQGGFEVQVSTDSLFATTTWTGIQYGTGRAIAIPEGTLSGTTTYYLRARRWSTAATPVDSGWGRTVTITTMADGTADLIHTPGQGAIVYELHWGHWLIGAKCRLHSTGTRTYACNLDRADFPVGNWWIAGVEESGRLETYTEQTTIAGVEATARSYFYDEQGAEGTANTFYIRPPNAPGGFDASGMMLVLAQPVSDQPGIRCGPGERCTADQWVKAHPSVTYAFGDVTAEAVATPQGSLVLTNPEWAEDADRRRVFDLALGEPDVFGNVAGLVGYRRRIRAALCGTPAFPIPYSERLHLFDGLFSWDEGNTVGVDSATFTTHGREAVEDLLYWRNDYIDGSAPSADPEHIGQSPQDALGAAKGLEPIYIGGGNRWRVGRHVTAITEWRVNGTVTSFTFDAGTHVVTESGAASPTAFRRAYDVTSTGGAASGYPTDLALEVLEDHAGYPTTDIATETFDAVKAWHATFIGSYPGLDECAVPVEERMTSGLEILQKIENAGAFRVCRTASGQVRAARMIPETVDDGTVFLHPADILGDIVTAIDSSKVSQYVSITFSNKTTATPGGGGGDLFTGKHVASGNYPSAQLLANSVREIQSAHTSQWYGADWVWQQLKPFQAVRVHKFDASRRVARAFAGGTVVLSVPRGKSDDGVLDFELCVVRSLEPVLPSCDVWHVECEHVKRVASADRPFRGEAS